jgi:hypothetical protein
LGYKVFICYRRVDKDFARTIEGILGEHFGADSIFLDTDEIKGGQQWKNRVIEVLDDKPVVVTLITTRWNSRRQGKPRLLDEKDHVRFELESAVMRGLLVVPVLYEPAHWPKSNQVPPTLHGVLEFQKVPFSSDRWKHDSDVLVKALTDLGVTPVAPVAPAKPPVPSPLRPQTWAAHGQLPARWTPSMFTEDPEVRKARLEEATAAAKAEQERKRQIRAQAEPFYARWEFWLAAVVTFAAGAAAVLGTEALTRSIASRWTSLPDPSIVAGVALVATWGIARIGMGAWAYWDDPSRGTRVFYLRGLLGGYTLWFGTWGESIAAWTAFPIASVLSWTLARGVAWPPYHYLHWSYDLTFGLVLAGYTLTALVVYVALTVEDL